MTLVPESCDFRIHVDDHPTLWPFQSLDLLIPIELILSFTLVTLFQNHRILIMIHFIHRCQLPLLLAFSPNGFKPPWNPQSMNPLHSLPTHQLASSFTLLFIQLRSHDSPLGRTLNTSSTLCFITLFGKKPALNGPSSPFGLRHSTS